MIADAPAAACASSLNTYAAPLDVPLETLVLGEGQALDAFAPDALPENTVPALRGLIERFAATDTYRATIVRARG